jgi:hypothetical protein
MFDINRPGTQANTATVVVHLPDHGDFAVSSMPDLVVRKSLDDDDEKDTVVGLGHLEVLFFSGKSHVSG